MRRNPQVVSLLLLALIPCAGLEAQTLQARLQGERLRVSAPHLIFFNARVLERLHNGAAVPFNFQLTAVPSSGGKAVAEASDRFVVSFDLWEERFSVVESGPPRRTISHLTSSAAEEWCLESLSIPVSALAAEKSFVLKLDIRAEEPADESAAEGNPGLSLAGLIDVFSRKPKEQPLRWSAVSGPIRLKDLKDQGVRRPTSNVRRHKERPSDDGRTLFDLGRRTLDVWTLM